MLEDGLTELAANWEDVMSRLGPEEADEIRRLVASLGDLRSTTASADIADLLTEALQADHPVRRALAKGYMLAPSPLVSPTLVAALRDRAAAPGQPPRDEFPSHAAITVILLAVRQRLLSAPALTEEQVRQRGADPDDQRLIALRGLGGQWQWPVFQFGPGGPPPVVLAVNEVLGAAADPVAAADWWLSRNGWLDNRPSELIGTVPDERLLSAARAATEVV